ncbi:hypothetical protein N8H74_25295 [Pseudomonas sp. B2M1-30]|uniref:Uncharacterized protein n=1 Tax=Pseudomonas koreensis TaxID=198620 RepID=A0A9X2XLZ7_9PSED|nr:MULTISPECIES: hypothetical protein [Pseudomonas]MBV4477786.1 hypothetical protein [Pseudomonas botevensis]MCU0121588.1 hypothetical protein [Pseudomonas sp. B2M1-30]MCU7250889.1 hypothetical protein [Pseudomonas koreensis]MCU7261316.1 hypothetical protein [Pseudomonas koreensis]
MTLSLQDIKPDQVEAFSKQSRAAFDAEIKSRQAVLSAKPALQEVLNQNVHPQSLCGCGCQQNVCGYFCFEGCGCGCAPHPETIQISSSLAIIGPEAPQQGTKVRFIGQASGSGSNIDISNAYLQGTVPDAENLVNVPLTLQLAINGGTLSLSLYEGNRLLTVLTHPTQYGTISGQFFGGGTGKFVPA